MTQPAILWQQLQQAGLVTADLPTQTTDDHQPAFFLRLLLGSSAWLSALFFCVFVVSVFISIVPNTDNIWMIGVILYALSLWVSRLAQSPLFVQQAVIACSLAGQALIAFGLLQSSDNSQFSAAVLLILEILLFALTGIRSQRATAIFLACGALLWLLGQYAWLYALPALSAATAWLWLNLLRSYKKADYLQPATLGLTLALGFTVFIALLANSSEFSGWRIAHNDWQTHLWSAAALSSVVCLLLAWQLIQRSVQHTQLRYSALLTSLGIGLVNLKMPGLAPLCLLLCIGVAQTHTRLVWCNLFALALYLLLYYYNLNNTLLYKSLLLCVSGALLFILYAVLKHYSSAQISEANTHA